MFYVYSRYLQSGREDYINDATTCQKDEYYYFMKKH